LAEINHSVDEGLADSPASMRNFVITTSASHSDDMSLMTDDCPTNYRRPPPCVPMEVIGQVVCSDEEESRHESKVLFTFQRRGNPKCDDSDDEGSLYETTLNARATGDDEESMEDIVKRLQQKGSSSGVLRFDKVEIEQI